MYFVVDDNSLSEYRIMKGDTAIIVEDMSLDHNDIGLFVTDEGLKLKRAGGNEGILIGKVVKVLVCCN